MQRWLTFPVRGLSILLTFLVYFYVPRRLSSMESGKFLSVLSYINLFPALFLFGGNTLVLKYTSLFSLYKHNTYIAKLVQTIIIRAFLIMMICILLTSVYCYWSNSSLTSTLLLLLFAFPLSFIQSVIIVLGECFKSIEKFSLSIFFSLVLTNLLFLLIVLIIGKGNFNIYYSIYLGCSLITFLSSFFYYKIRFDVKIHIYFFNLILLSKRGFWMCCVFFLQMIPYTSDIFLCDILLGHAPTGYYTIIKKIALVVYIPAQILNIVVSQRIARLRFESPQQLPQYLKQELFKILFITSLISFFIYLFGDTLLDYILPKGAINREELVCSLRVLVVGHATLSLSVPIVSLLLMINQERKLSMILLITSSTFFCSFLFIREKIHTIEMIALLQTLTLVIQSITVIAIGVNILNRKKSEHVKYNN